MATEWTETVLQMRKARLMRDVGYTQLAKEVGVSYPVMHRIMTDLAYVPYERTQHKCKLWLAKGGALSRRQWRHVKALDEHEQTGDTE